jgi:nitrite reductase/ring-hydroxylating ferredoxin subunit
MDPLSSLPPFPESWYFACRSDDLRSGAILPIRLAGRDLVVYRTSHGRAVAADARCPHLGASFATGGSVEGGELRCGMHGFCFDGDGRCTRTGYGGRIPAKALLRTHRVLERNGLVMVWFSAAGRAPAWEIPALDLAGFSSLTTKAYALRGHPQETTENSVDLGHLHVLHGYRDVEMTAPLRTEGAYLTTSFAFSRSAEFLGSLDEARVFYTAHVHGLGYSFVDVDVPRFGVRTQQFVLTRPTDAGELEMTIGIRARPSAAPGASLHARIAHRALSEVLSLLVFQAFKADVSRDFPIWEKKAYLAQPALAEGDGPIGAYRRWARQFYPELHAPAALDARAFERAGGAA